MSPFVDGGGVDAASSAMPARALASIVSGSAALPSLFSGALEASSMPESAAARSSRSSMVPGATVGAEPSSSSLSPRRMVTVRAGVPTRIF